MFFNWHKITVFFILFYVSITIEAQEITTIENVTSGTKLQNHNILGIAQDSQGYLWIGTNWGLYSCFLYKSDACSIFPFVVCVTTMKI